MDLLFAEKYLFNHGIYKTGNETTKRMRVFEVIIRHIRQEGGSCILHTVSITTD
jgi:hypothetical protein